MVLFTMIIALKARTFCEVHTIPTSMKYEHEQVCKINNRKQKKYCLERAIRFASFKILMFKN